jgi:hypothetical protein
LSAGEVADGDAGAGPELDAPGLAVPLVLGVPDDDPLIEPDGLLPDVPLVEPGLAPVPDIDPVLELPLLESVVGEPVPAPVVEGLVDDEDDALDGEGVLDVVELVLGLVPGVEEVDDDGVVSWRLQPYTPATAIITNALERILMFIWQLLVIR